MNMRENLLKLRPGFPKGHTQLDACIILPEIIKADALIMSSGKQNDIAFKGAQCRSNRMRIGCLGVVIKFYTIFLSYILQTVLHRLKGGNRLLNIANRYAQLIGHTGGNHGIGEIIISNDVKALFFKQQNIP